MPLKLSTKIIWLDLEMTGLDPESCHILEIACIITDQNLNVISAMFHLVLNQPDSILQTMGDWCKVHHRESGLIVESRESSVTVAEAEEHLLQFLKKHTPPGECPLAGNTIYMDKLFLMKYLPRVVEHLHYRIIDVSTILELHRRWYPNLKTPWKNRSHRAKDDVLESIEELKYYKEAIFKPNAKKTKKNSNK